jgi:hypothetical protein
MASVTAKRITARLRAPDIFILPDAMHCKPTTRSLNAGPIHRTTIRLLQALVICGKFSVVFDEATQWDRRLIWPRPLIQEKVSPFRLWPEWESGNGGR